MTQKNDNLKRCTKCVMPETWESINFDEKGICNICRNAKFKKEKINWKAKRQEFIEFIGQFKGKGQYDCIVPFSGGKDSTFTLWSVVKEFGLKPLVVCFDHGFFRPKILASRERTLKKIGVDFLSFRPSCRVVKKVMLEALKRKGDFCWHCHSGCFAYPMQIAVKFKIPLVIWGEPSAEYGGYYSYDDDEEIDEKRFNMYVNLGITAQDMQGMIKDLTMRDLEPFKYPSLDELRQIKCRSVCLGSFIPWDVKNNVKIIKRELGWQEDRVEGLPPGYGYEKVECIFQGIRDYLKFIKRGLGRTAHLTSIDIRNNRMKRAEAMRLTNKYDGLRPASLDIFLQALDLNEKEFMEIAMSHEVAPYRHNPAKTKKGKPLWDQNLWDKTKN
jgi:N-acetyl sugar amidotransferase